MKTKNTKGFTLIELLVVISIIGLLSSILLVAVTSQREKARLAGARSFAAQVQRVAGDQGVAYWDFDDCSGSTVKDGSGFGFNGSFIGSAGWSTDSPNPSGCSLSEDGTNYVNIPSNDTLNIRTGSATRTLWFKTSQNPIGNLFRISDGVNVGGMIITGRGVSNNLSCYIDTAGSVEAEAKIAKSYSDGNWHFVACVLDRSANTLNLYVDGHLANSVSASAFIGVDMNSTTYHGIGGWSGGVGYVGLIDGVHLYSKNLTAFQIQNLYLAEGGKLPNFAVNK